MDCSFDFLGILVREAKKFERVDFIPQIHSVGYPKSPLKTPSFCLEAWERCGRLHQWKELTLELPRTAGAKIPDQPFILLSDHSQSSPFASIEDLYESIQKTFPSHSIVRCSTIRLPLLTGLLTLMDAADLIVAIDSAPLHLSRACKTPVIALVTDQPSTWHGSAWHPRFSLHVRYSDYELRKSELLWTAKQILKTS